MEKIKSGRYRIIIIIILLAIIIGVFVIYSYRESIKKENELEMIQDKDIIEELVEIEDTEITEEIEEIKEIELIIHMAGAVKKPGIIYIEDGDRLIDGIKKAGGLTEDADVNRINLARRLRDEEKIYIRKYGEEIEEEDFIEENMEDINKSGIIGINSGSKEELMSLPGIGDKTSDKIIDYRESNRFLSVEDIMNVSGIGEKKFEAIKDMINTN